MFLGLLNQILHRTVYSGIRVTPIRELLNLLIFLVGEQNLSSVALVRFWYLSLPLIDSVLDDGNIFIWDKNTGSILNIFHGDASVVNIVEGHPIDCVLASSGIENNVKLFSPIGTQPFDIGQYEDLARSNQERVTQSPV